MNNNNKYTFKNETVRRANNTSNTQRTTNRQAQQYRPVQQTRQQQPTRPVQQKPKQQNVNYQNPNNSEVKGCLSCLLAFWFRSAVLSVAIYLAMRCLGLIGGNDFVLKRESLEGPVTFASQEYNLTDEDLEAFTALMNDELLTEEQKEYVYSLNK